MLAAGGTGTLEYSIDGGTNYFSSGLFTNLPSAIYTVRIKDAVNCMKDTLISGCAGSGSLGRYCR